MVESTEDCVGGISGGIVFGLSIEGEADTGVEFGVDDDDGEGDALALAIGLEKL
jgi:hypothetical protein